MLRIATFSADVTPPLGHPLLACHADPDAIRIDDPLLAKGFVLLGPDRPIVVLSIDWCEIRNGGTRAGKTCWPRQRRPTPSAFS
jgi:hypothetical protein